MMSSVPGRTSDAGPDRPESPMDWHDHAIAAECHLREACGLARADKAVEKKLRRSELESARDSILSSLESL